jgi:cytochrome c oxidase subunit 2
MTPAIDAHSVLDPAGVQAAHILHLWHITLAVCGLVFLLVLAVLGAALARRRRATAATPAILPASPGAERGPWRAIAAASAASVVILLGLLAADVYTERALSAMPLDNPVRIEMIGHQWWWEIRYPEEHGQPGFTTANELRIPVGRPVILTLKAADVIHTFWAPNLQGKKDMLPGRDSTLTLRADKPGEYRGTCAEFCGAQHALMAFSVVAATPADYAAWLAAQRRAAPEPEQPRLLQGRQVFLTHSCAGCHTIRGTPASGTVGPDLTHLASRPMIAAGALPNDPGTLAAWVADPQSAKPGVGMPPTGLSDEDMQALVAYLETLQ